MKCSPSQFICLLIVGLPLRQRHPLPVLEEVVRIRSFSEFVRIRTFSVRTFVRKNVEGIQRRRTGSEKKQNFIYFLKATKFGKRHVWIKN